MQQVSRGGKGAQLGGHSTPYQARTLHFVGVGPQEHTINYYLAPSAFGSKAMDAYSTTIRFAWTSSFLVSLLWRF